MKYFTFTKYLYLLVGFFMLYDAYEKWSSHNNQYLLSLFFAAMAFFLFYFRGVMIKKAQNRSQSQTQK